MRLSIIDIVLAGFPALSGLVQADDMGPAAFVWPQGRTWSSTSDNSGPCGSPDGVTTRTQFPLTNGAVSILLNQASFNVNLAISYTNDPHSNADFIDLVPYSNFPTLAAGRECYSVPDPLSGATTGTNATLQLAYLSENTDGETDTFYTCADITYIELSAFTEAISCYNSTAGSGVTQSAVGVAPTPAASGSASSSGSHHSRLSGGAIAGIVVGILVAAGFVISTVLLMIRRRAQQIEKRVSANMRMAELKRLSKELASTKAGSSQV